MTQDKGYSNNLLRACRFSGSATLSSSPVISIRLASSTVFRLQDLNKKRQLYIIRAQK
uniref:Uncharacterized protein n=1 Tax=Arundo donax TaxID=35708 RepID=A0A0A9BMT9_ARUDO